MAGNTHGPSQASTILPATRQPFLPHPTNAPSARVRGNLDGTIAHKSVVSSVHARADGGGKEQAVRQDVQQNGVHGDHSPSALDVLAIAAATFPQDTVGSKRKAVGGAGQRSKRVAANKVSLPASVTILTAIRALMGTTSHPALSTPAPPPKAAASAAVVGAIRALGSNSKTTPVSTPVPAAASVAMLGALRAMHSGEAGGKKEEGGHTVKTPVAVSASRAVLCAIQALDTGQVALEYTKGPRKNKGPGVLSSGKNKGGNAPFGERNGQTGAGKRGGVQPDIGDGSSEEDEKQGEARHAQGHPHHKRMQPAKALQQKHKESWLGGHVAAVAAEEGGEEGAEEGSEWTQKQVEDLHKWYHLLNPQLPDFWSQVAKLVGRSMQECMDKHFESIDEGPLLTRNKGPRPTRYLAALQEDAPAPALAGRGVGPAAIRRAARSAWWAQRAEQRGLTAVMDHDASDADDLDEEREEFLAEMAEQEKTDRYIDNLRKRSKLLRSRGAWAAARRAPVATGALRAPVAARAPVAGQARGMDPTAIARRLIARAHPSDNDEDDEEEEQDDYMSMEDDEEEDLQGYM